jgi:energy-coupling factor transporter ATP-binding protein EcfA2
MVQPVSSAPFLGKHNHEGLKIVEIIGPAGAGKTTLFKALSGYPDQIRLRKIPNIQRSSYFTFFICHSLRLIPDLIRLYRPGSRPLRLREFAWMSILTGWPSVLYQEKRKYNKSIVLDQGPVYLFAEMKENGPDCLRTEKAEIYWQSIYARWAATLDIIVCLDADDSVLMDRIQTRAKEHVVKHEPTPVIFEFLGQFRKTYAEVVSVLEKSRSGPRILRFDTGIHPTKEIVDCLLVELGIT